MQELVSQIALFTFAAQLFLFAVPLAASACVVIYAVYSLVYTIFFESEAESKKYFAERYARSDAMERARNRADKGYSAAEGPNLPKLKPLNCPNCGAGVPLRGPQMLCPSCRSGYPVPAEYEQIGRLRNDVSEKLRRATMYWNRASLLTSRWVTAAILAIALWHIAALPILFIAEENGYIDKYEQALAKYETLGIIAVFTWIFWIIVLLFTAFFIEPKARKNLPTLESADNLGMAEIANCLQCGGTISYERSDLAAVCGYCGVETYRAKLAWDVRGLTNNIRQKASFSLIDAAEAFEQAYQDILWTPVLLISLFITLPFFMIVVPFYLYDYIKDEHPFVGIALIAAAVVSIAAAIYRSETKKA